MAQGKKALKLWLQFSCKHLNRRPTRKGWRCATCDAQFVS